MHMFNKTGGNMTKYLLICCHHPVKRLVITNYQFQNFISLNTQLAVSLRVDLLKQTFSINEIYIYDHGFNSNLVNHRKKIKFIYVEIFSYFFYISQYLILALLINTYTLDRFCFQNFPTIDSELWRIFFPSATNFQGGIIH